MYLIGHFRQLLLIPLVPEILTVGQPMELALNLFINTKSIISHGTNSIVKHVPNIMKTCVAESLTGMVRNFYHENAKEPIENRT